MPDQRRDIRRTLAQRRHRDREDVQPVEQVFAKAAGFDVGDQIAIGGGDKPHVDLHGLPRADRLDFAFLDGAQEFHLRRRRQFADLVEKQRAAGGLDEFADMALGGAGERAFFVAEQNRTRRGFPAWRRN